MRILVVNVVAATGSTGRICRDLYQAYTAAGHHCCLAYGRGSLPAAVRSFKIGHRLDMYAHGAETLLRDNHGQSSRRVTRRFIEFLGHFRPDVIHLHNIHGYYLNFPMLFDYLKHQFTGRVIWTLHDMWAITGHPAHLPEPARYRDSVPRRDSHHWAYPPSAVNRYARNLALKRATFSAVPNLTITTPSRWLQSVLEQSFLSQYPMRTVYNGLDLAVFRPAAAAPTSTAVVLAVANIWEPNKGLPDVLALARRLPQGYRVRVVGRLLPGTRLPRGVEHVARTRQAGQLAQAYSDATVLVNPTRHETLSMVNLEAQACGTPVITYDTDGAPETILDGRTGWVVRSRQVDEMLALVLACRKTEALSAACVEHAQFFSRQRMGREYVALLD
jgi:glycosyltransferase involved in cell wall biosynthesis